MKPIEASGMDLDDAKDKLEVKDKAVKDLSSEEMTSKVMANDTTYAYIEARTAKKSQTQKLNFRNKCNLSMVKLKWVRIPNT